MACALFVFKNNTNRLYPRSFTSSASKCCIVILNQFSLPTKPSSPLVSLLRAIIFFYKSQLQNSLHLKLRYYEGSFPLQRLAKRLFCPIRIDITLKANIQMHSNFFEFLISIKSWKCYVSRIWTFSCQIVINKPLMILNYIKPIVRKKEAEFRLLVKDSPLAVGNINILNRNKTY